MVDSNHRRHSQQIYSLEKMLILSAKMPIDIKYDIPHKNF